MGELTLTVFRLGLLALLWLFVFSVVGVLRTDLYGTRVSNRSRRTTARRTAKGQADLPRAAAPPSPPARGPAVPTALVVTAGNLAGTAIPLRPSGVLIGRNPECALVVDDDFASGRHARVFPEADGWFVEDLGSTNGTFLDGARLGSEPAPVRIGSKLGIGRTVLELQG